LHLEGNTDGAALQDDDVMILLPRGLPDGGSQPWLLATLEMLGIPNDRVIHADPETRYYAEELFVPTAACLGRPSREMVERVRARCAGLVLPPPPFLPLCPCHLDWNFPTQRGLFGLALCVLRRLRGVVFSRAGPCSFSPGATVTLPAAARRIILVKRRDVEERALENHNELEARLRFEFPPDSVHVYALRMQSSAHRTRGAPE
jgi:hypothetical protein